LRDRRIYGVQGSGLHDIDSINPRIYRIKQSILEEYTAGVATGRRIKVDVKTGRKAGTQINRCERWKNIARLTNHGTQDLIIIKAETASEQSLSRQLSSDP
jgi:hypothetical protein